MGRKRIALTPAEEVDFAARVRAGQSVSQIAAAFRGKLSNTTIKARRLEVLGARPLAPAPQPEPAVCQAQDDDPAADEPAVEVGEADAPPELHDEAVAEAWLRRADRMFAAAQAAGKPGEAATWGRLVATFLEHRRKARPPEIPPTDERPDMVEMRERARARFHDLVDRALRGAL